MTHAWINIKHKLSIATVPLVVICHNPCKRIVVMLLNSAGIFYIIYWLVSILKLVTILKIISQ